MHIGSRGEAFAPETQKDKELTLGPTMLAVLGLALAALCAFCFISGYAIGHGSSSGQTVTAEKSAPSAAQLFSAQPKPSATPPAAQPTADAGAAADPATAAPADAAVVPAALPTQPSGAQPAAAAQPLVHSALGQNGQPLWMVQIAAVANSEDADVLLSALRKRGFNVSMQRDAVDSLMHVQVGPFNNHAEAVAMRQRLLDAGYNAIIQP